MFIIHGSTWSGKTSLLIIASNTHFKDNFQPDSGLFTRNCHTHVMFVPGHRIDHNDMKSVRLNSFCMFSILSFLIFLYKFIYSAPYNDFPCALLSGNVSDSMQTNLDYSLMAKTAGKTGRVEKNCTFCAKEHWPACIACTIYWAHMITYVQNSWNIEFRRFCTCIHARKHVIIISFCNHRNIRYWIYLG